MIHFLKKDRLFGTDAEKLFNRFAVAIAFFGSFVIIPQVWNVWVLKEFSGVSLLTFGFFFVGNIFWFGYGLLHSDKAIMVSNLTQGVLNLMIVVGKIIG